MSPTPPGRPSGGPPGGPPGGAAVGTLDGLTPLGALAVLALRRWCDAGQGALAADLAAGDAREGEAAAEAMGALCRHALGCARRPLLRHGPTCPCLGADEAAFAELVRQAAEGEREDALLLACCLVPAHRAPGLVALAEAAGLSLLRAMMLRGATRAAPEPRVLH